MWRSRVDCVSCIETYGDVKSTPCSTCRPSVHPYNVDVFTLYNACSDQLIVGMSGAVAINDIAIGHAMKTYFKVAKKDRLLLSLRVRGYYQEVLKAEADKPKRK